MVEGRPPESDPLLPPTVVARDAAGVNAA